MKVTKPHGKMFNKGQILPCLSLPPLPAHTVTAGSCTMLEAPSKSITVTQRGLSDGACSQFQHKAHSLQAQAWEQKKRELWQGHKRGGKRGKNGTQG